VTEQLLLFDLIENVGPPALDVPQNGGNGGAGALSRHVPAGPARLLRDLVNGGLDHGHLGVAAALVLELDAEAERGE
jgi:hypothetical protein